MAAHLSFYEFDFEGTFTWGVCGWTGMGREASGEVFAELFEVNCPSCDRTV